MKVIYLLAALLLSAAVVILLGLSPQRITDDIMSLLHRDRSLKYKVLVTQGKIKKSRMQRMIDNITSALAATHSQNKFSLLITAAVVGGVVGVLLGALFNNLLISVVLIAAAFVIPYVYVKLLLSSYKAHIAEELETALSIITTNYISNGDIAYAVRQSIDHINPPVQYAFINFLTRVDMISSNVKLAIEQLKDEIDNEIFHEWCDTLIECQDNSEQKFSLQPLAARLSDIRIVNAELKNMIMQPRKEVFTMIGLVLANYPLIFFLNADWFAVLTETLAGQIVNCVVAVTVIIVIALTYKYTQPIEYKR